MALISLFVCVFAVSEGLSQNVISDQANASYRYNPKGKIDPFKPLVREVVAKKNNRPTTYMGPTAIERMGLDQLRLVGIGSYENTRIAVVTDNKGKSYILTRGSAIGVHRGKVAEILSDQIIIEEVMSEEGKNKKFRRIPMRLYKEESEGK